MATAPLTTARDIPRAPKLGEIAERIAVHLKRIEMAQPDRGSGRSQYWHANAWPAGSKVGIHYISYQLDWKLTKAEAWTYLQWLDAGNVGTHRAIAAAGDGT